MKMELNCHLTYGLIYFVCCLLKPGYSTPTKTLTDVLTKLDLISNEHQHIMSVLQKLTESKEDGNNQPTAQCDKSGKITEDIADTLKYLKDKLDIPGAREIIEGSGATYIRWGRTTCPRKNGTVEVYNGYAGGEHYTRGGGSVELLCLPKYPTWGNYNDASLGYSSVYGAEYEPGSVEQSMKIFRKNLNQQNVPCVVCQSIGRLAALRIPGQIDCYNGWTKEYDGYLMGGYHGHKKQTGYTCIDSDPEAVPGSAHNQNGHLLYFVEAHCSENSLPCPPYVHGREIPCVICTK